MLETQGRELLDPAYYGEHGAPHDLWTAMRRESPVHRCEPDGFQPFWAITKHQDIIDVSKQPNLFLNEPGIVLLDDKSPGGTSADSFGMRTIIEMDPPDHQKFRKVTSAWFTPRALGRLDDEIDASARSLVDELAEKGECDFAREIAVRHPLRILSRILGLTEEQEPDVLRLTNQLFANNDPEFQRQGEDPQKVIEELGMELFGLFSGVIEDRRKNPQDDLTSIIANATIDGEPMGPMETFGYCLIVFTAGHDTTKNGLAGGMQCLIQNPDEIEKIRRDPDLDTKAVEEMVRWATPVNYMRRTAAQDVDFRGQKIKKGDHLGLFYASANRDEEVFDDPFEFRVERDPNRHLGFGIGEHFCLGANLARRSQRALIRELIPRVRSIEAAGPAVNIQSSFVVGLKHLPMRCELAPHTD